MNTRSGIKESGQIGKFGAITDLATQDFSIESGEVGFNIKNNTASEITLSVIPYGSSTAVSCIFYPGWNVEIVGKIVTNVAITDTDLSWGY